MKAIFFSKTLLWRIVFTCFALLVIAGLIQFNRSFTSVRTDNPNSVSATDVIDSIIEEQGDTAGEKKAPLNLDGEKGGLRLDGAEQNANQNANQPHTRKNQFFIEYRMERDRARGQQIDLLREIVNNANSGEDVRKEAQHRLLQISHLLEKEMEIENMIRAKDYKDAVVFLQEKTATVIVQVKELSDDEQQKIKGIVNRAAQIDESKIVIIPKP